MKLLLKRHKQQPKPICIAKKCKNKYIHRGYMQCIAKEVQNLITNNPLNSLNDSVP